MKYPILFIITIILFWSCSGETDQSNIESNSELNEIAENEEQKRLEAEQLQNVLLNDSIDLDSLQWCIERTSDLDYKIVHKLTESVNGLGKQGGWLNSWTSQTVEDRKEMTALNLAFSNQHINYEEAIIMLLEAGADPNKMTSDSISNLDFALFNYHQIKTNSTSTASDVNQAKKMIDTLLYFKADPGQCYVGNLRNDIQMIDKMVGLGADPSNIDLYSFFEYTYQFKNANTWKSEFKRALDLGANPKGFDPYVAYPDKWDYHWDPFVLDQLIAHGLDLNEPVRLIDPNAFRFDEAYEYWLDYCIIQTNNEKMLSYLLDHGATACKEGFDAVAEAQEAGFPQYLLDLLAEKINK